MNRTIQFILHSVLLISLLSGCSETFNKEGKIDEPSDTGLEDTDNTDADTSDTDTSDTDDTDDTDVVEVDPIEEGRTAITICSAGGRVEGSSISGSYCFGAVDISPSPKATSASFQWQPGPYTAVSP